MILFMHIGASVASYYVTCECVGLIPTLLFPGKKFWNLYIYKCYTVNNILVIGSPYVENTWKAIANTFHKNQFSVKLVSNFVAAYTKYGISRLP